MLCIGFYFHLHHMVHFDYFNMLYMTTGSFVFAMILSYVTFIAV